MHNRRPWTATLEVKPETIKVLVTEGEGDDVLKAVFTGSPNHPRALLTLLEGLALWSGTPRCAAMCAAEPVSHSLGLGAWELSWPEHSALVSFELVDPSRPRRRIGQVTFRALRAVAEHS